MILVYRPTEGDEKRWDLDDTKVTFAEAKAAEHAGGFRWAERTGELTQGNVSALQAILWILRKREEPTLRFADLEDLDVDSVDTEYGAAEKSFMRGFIENNAELTAEDKAAAIAALGFTAEEAAESAPKARTRKKS